MLVVELTEALDRIPGAWDGWRAADGRTREQYAAWVAEPRGARVRRKYAQSTADRAAHGTLGHEVDRSEQSDVVLDVAGSSAEPVAASLAGRAVRFVTNLID